MLNHQIQKKLIKALATHNCQLTKANLALVKNHIAQLKGELDQLSEREFSTINQKIFRQKKIKNILCNIESYRNSISSESLPELTDDQARHVAICCLYGDVLPSSRLFNVLAKITPKVGWTALVLAALLMFLPLFAPVPVILTLGGGFMACLGYVPLAVMTWISLDAYTSGDASAGFFRKMADEEKRLRIKIADDAKTQITEIKAGTTDKDSDETILTVSRVGTINGEPGSEREKSTRQGLLSRFSVFFLGSAVTKQENNALGEKTPLVPGCGLQQR
jgi:hypothetical protein